MDLGNSVKRQSCNVSEYFALMTRDVMDKVSDSIDTVDTTSIC